MRRRKGTLAAMIGLAVLAIAGARGRLRRYLIAERSMLPALSPGDWTLARRTNSGTARGTVVVFPHPNGRGMELVKRVVGLPGETVVVANGQVHVDGRVLAEPWADGPTRPDGEWKLGEEEIFVLGDARAISAADSRSFGPVLSATAVWRVAATYWPPGSLGRV